MNLTIVTVTYGKRFLFLKHVLDAVREEPRSQKIILVDNASEDGALIDAYIQKANMDEKKIILVRHAENTGSAGGFHSGLAEARKHPCDYVLLLDDDTVPEPGWGKRFETVVSLLDFDQKKIIHGNRAIAAGAQMDFNDPYPKSTDPLRLNILRELLRRIMHRNVQHTPSSPIIPSTVCSYGGTLIPYEAIVSNDLPDTRFYLYFDDFEYFDRLRESGYNFYATLYPRIMDVDSSFSDKKSSTHSFYAETANDMKTFYYVRNRAYLRLVRKTQSRASVWLHSYLWALLQILYGFYISKRKSRWVHVSALILNATQVAFR